MTIRRRTLVKFGLFLLAGAVVNVGVAWGAILVEQGLGGPGSPTRPLPAPRDWPFAVPDGWPAPTRAFGARRISQSSQQFDTMPLQPTTIAASPPPRPSDIKYATSRSAGLPFRSMTERLWIDSGGGTARRIGALRVGANAIGGDRTLPWRPLLPGFAANTALYAALAYAPFGFVGWRRARRRSRDRCPSCGYAITDLPTCPECGETIRRKVVEA